MGHFAVQIAKALGARMAATCGPSNVAFVESLGADMVIDYSREDFTRRPEQYDVVFDAVAKSAFPACRHLLKPGGTYVTTLPGPAVLFWGAVAVGRRDIRACEAGKIPDGPPARSRPCVSRPAGRPRQVPADTRPDLPLERAREAHDESEQWHTRGKIVLEM